MREGKLYINNLDAYATYGVFLANDRGGTYDNLSALMTPPPVKKYTTVDYRERDGEEVDAMSPSGSPWWRRASWISGRGTRRLSMS